MPRLIFYKSFLKRFSLLGWAAVFFPALAHASFSSVSGSEINEGILTASLRSTYGMDKQQSRARWLGRIGVDYTIARVNPTPGAVTIKKTKHDLTIVCTKKGYEETTYLNHSGSEGATFGNIILGGGIGWAVDSANGSDNHYETPVNITLPKK